MNRKEIPKNEIRMEYKIDSHCWIMRYREGSAMDAPDDERAALNIAIAEAAANGIAAYSSAGMNHAMQKAAKMMMHLARQQDSEPMASLKKVCRGWAGLDVYPESFLIGLKYAKGSKSAV